MWHERRCCRGGNDLLMINPPSLFGTSQMRAAMILPEGLGPSPSNLDEESKVISSLSSKAFTFKIKQYFLYFFFVLLVKKRGRIPLQPVGRTHTGAGFFQRICDPWRGTLAEEGKSVSKGAAEWSCSGLVTAPIPHPQHHSGVMWSLGRRSGEGVVLIWFCFS